jgi:hypothetical protein
MDGAPNRGKKRLVPGTVAIHPLDAPGADEDFAVRLDRNCHRTAVNDRSESSVEGLTMGRHRTQQNERARER